MRLTARGAPLELCELSLPAPGEHEILIAVEACGVCRTDLHVLDGELPDIHTPLTPGHEVVGRVLAAGPGVERFRRDDRVGVPWPATPAGYAPIAVPGGRTCASTRALPGIRVTAAMPSRCWRMLATASACLPGRPP